MEAGWGEGRERQCVRGQGRCWGGILCVWGLRAGRGSTQAVPIALFYFQAPTLACLPHLLR